MSDFDKIFSLVTSGDKDNIELGFQLAKGQGMTRALQNRIYEDYKLLASFGLATPCDTINLFLLNSSVEKVLEVSVNFWDHSDPIFIDKILKSITTYYKSLKLITYTEYRFHNFAREIGEIYGEIHERNIAVYLSANLEKK